MTGSRVTGHLRLVQRKRGPQWYLKYRLANGRQVQRHLGPAWTGKGRPSAGYYTKRMAEEALQAILTDARRGTLGAHQREAPPSPSPMPPPNISGSCATCANATTRPSRITRA